MFGSKSSITASSDMTQIFLQQLHGLEQSFGRLQAIVEQLQTRVTSLADEAEGSRLTARNRHGEVAQQITNIHNSLQRLTNDVQALRGVHGAKATAR